MDATLGIRQYNYNPAPLGFEPLPALFTNLRSLQEKDNSIQLPLVLSSGTASTTLGGGAAHYHWGPAGTDVKIEEGRAPPQMMAVGPGLLDGAYLWGF